MSWWLFCKRDLCLSISPFLGGQGNFSFMGESPMYQREILYTNASFLIHELWFTNTNIMWAPFIGESLMYLKEMPHPQGGHLYRTNTRINTNTHTYTYTLHIKAFSLWVRVCCVERDSQKHTHIYTNTHTYAHTPTRGVCVCVCICVYACVFLGVCLHTTHSHSHWRCVCVKGVCVRVCVRVCICVHECVFLGFSWEVGGWGRVPFSRN